MCRDCDERDRRDRKQDAEVEHDHTCELLQKPVEPVSDATVLTQSDCHRALLLAAAQLLRAECNKKPPKSTSGSDAEVFVYFLIRLFARIRE